MQTGDLKITDGAVAGNWIKRELGSEVDTVAEQVPQIYEAYARVFHPAYDWDLNPVRWAKVAEAKGTTAHREMQWDALVGKSGWGGQIPLPGVMNFSDLDSLCEILAAHTADPGECYFGLCTLQGWLDTLPVGYLKPFFRLPDRDYIVLVGPLAAVDQISRDWSGAGLIRASFTIPRAEVLAQLAGKEEGSRRDVPNLIWPEDRSWFVASEGDFDSTLVGGSAELIKAIVESPALEAWQVEPTDSLAYDADKINGGAS